MANSREERIKLAANFANGLAVAVAALGILAPLVNGSVQKIPIAVCLLISGALHFIGHLILKRLRDG